MANEVFPIIPAQASVYLILIPILLILFIGGGVATYAAFASRHVKFEVSNDGVTIRGDMFGRFVPKDKMVLKSARAVDLDQETDLKPKWRTGGTGYPGYKSGWYRLANNSQALVFITDPHHVVYIPTVDGSALMMSIAKPDEFLHVLKAQ